MILINLGHDWNKFLRRIRASILNMVNFAMKLAEYFYVVSSRLNSPSCELISMPSTARSWNVVAIFPRKWWNDVGQWLDFCRANVCHCRDDFFVLDSLILLTSTSLKVYFPSANRHDLTNMLIDCTFKRFVRAIHLIAPILLHEARLIEY